MVVPGPYNSPPRFDPGGLAPARREPRVHSRILPAHPVGAALVMIAFTALLYVLELIDQLAGLRLDYEGIAPRTLDGLWGILWAPFLHHGFGHLIANTLPFLVFGFLAMAEGVGRWFGVTAVIWLGSGIAVWLTGAPGVTVGASGVIFGWLAFLLTRGFFARSGKQILLAVVLFVFEGGMLFGVLPGQANVSWQGHLFGALFGVVAAWLFARNGHAARRLRGAQAL